MTKMKRFTSIFSTVLLVLVLVLASALVGVKLFGIDPYTVLSGSMEPTYHVGSIIYVVDVEPEELKVGDPLTFVIGGGTVVTHRIIEIITDEENPSDIRFRVQGDANEHPDGDPVRKENIIGKPIFTIPLLGYGAYVIQTPPFSYFAIGGCAVILLLTFIPDLLDKLFNEESAGKAKPSEDLEGKREDEEKAENNEA